jgi:hypothetical protein
MRYRRPGRLAARVVSAAVAVLVAQAAAPEDPVVRAAEVGALTWPCVPVGWDLALRDAAVGTRGVPAAVAGCPA